MRILLLSRWLVFTEKLRNIHVKCSNRFTCIFLFGLHRVIRTYGIGEPEGRIIYIFSSKYQTLLLSFHLS
jgi:hypothetical protein